MTQEKGRANAWQLGELGDAVAERAQRLQGASIADAPWAVSVLAQLRRAVGNPPGRDPEIWPETIGLVPEQLLGRGEEPTASELAAHHAMTLFALHRQGRSEKAHIPGVGPGTAFASLARRRGGGEGDSEGVRRRFDAMVTATSPQESAHHLRGLVTLMRSEQVGMDYGQLADDLAGLWSRRRDAVRLRWARQYRRLRPPPPSEEPPTPALASTHEESA